MTPVGAHDSRIAVLIRVPVSQKTFLPFVAAIVVGAFACVARAPAPAAAPIAPIPVAEAAPPPARTPPPRVYVAKVKNILVGTGPTDAEIRRVEADPAALEGLVTTWMQRPEYEQKMMRFFQLAFQQTQVNANDFAPQVYGMLGRNATSTPLLLQNLAESFARTMVELTRRGEPLTAAMTTRQLMMTTALKEFYAFLDTQQIDNQGNLDDLFRRRLRGTPIVVQARRPVPIEQTVDPKSPLFMHWYDPDLLTEEPWPECRQDRVMLAPSAIDLHWLLLGSVAGRRMSKKLFCPGFDGTAKGLQFAPTDFSDWTMVTLRPPREGEAASVFYDLPALRQARELVLSVPRAGFYSTPAFFANWPTNVSNQMRVTINQALIVATGSSIDGTDGTMAPGTPGLDAAHARRADCFSCHKTMDPTRSILSATWSYGYHRQTDAGLAAQPGLFAFRGVVEPVKTLGDFGAVLARHPLVAPAWVQKLCHYVNSGPCNEDDPEFARIVTRFRDSGFSWSTLLRSLLTSTLTIRDEVVAVSRRNHLCAALDARLGLTDICGLDVLGATSLGTVPDIASGLPSDAYGRGAVSPILPNDPTLFFAAGVRNICEHVALEVVDGTRREARRRWSSAEPEAAITDFVGEVMGLPPSDPKAAPAQALLHAHFTAALKEPGTTATQALRSTFVIACQAPSTVSIGL